MNKTQRDALREMLAKGQTEELLRYSIPYLTGLVAALPALLDQVDELEARVERTERDQARVGEKHVESIEKILTVSPGSFSASARVRELEAFQANANFNAKYQCDRIAALEAAQRKAIGDLDIAMDAGDYSEIREALKASLKGG